jgi:hypothetical protein
LFVLLLEVLLEVLVEVEAVAGMHRTWPMKIVYGEVSELAVARA